MMDDAFLLCRHCGALHPASTPALADDGAGLDLVEFRATHEGHGLEEAQRLPDSTLCKAPPWDPMGARWFSVSTTTDQLAVCCWRSSIDDPRRYEVAPSPPAATDRVEIDEPLLRRALDRHFYPHALRPTALERFVDAVRQLVADLDPAAVDTAFDDAALPNTSIGPFPTALCDLLVSRCTAIFDPWELERVHRFIDDHRHADGTLAVRVRRILDRSAA
jgi:hypothetical protein